MGKLTNLNPSRPLTEADMPPGMATDTEFTAADAAHLAATDPHLQYPTQARGDARYLRYFDSFKERINPPINLVGGTWQELGSARVVGEQGKGASWLVNIYFQYEAPPGGQNQAWLQYCGFGSLGVIFWQADLLSNQGVEIPMEAHNEVDFTARIRFGRGQLRKLEINPSRAINIANPGFGEISGVRIM
jgi:hypothetical protein